MVEHQEETSQGSQARPRSTIGSKDRTKKNSEDSPKGDVAELKNNVYIYGSAMAGDAYLIKTTDATAEYVGREHSKEMRQLVKNKVEGGPTEPKMPKGKEADDKAIMKKCDRELSRHFDKLDKCNDDKSKVFVIVKGQCSLTMKNKVETTPKHDDIEKNDDAIKLLEGLKELAFATADVQYECWTAAQSLRRTATMKQRDDESLAQFYKRFIHTTEVAESQLGKTAPKKLEDKRW